MPCRQPPRPRRPVLFGSTPSGLSQTSAGLPGCRPARPRPLPGAVSLLLRHGGHSALGREENGLGLVLGSLGGLGYQLSVSPQRTQRALAVVWGPGAALAPRALCAALWVLSWRRVWEAGPGSRLGCGRDALSRRGCGAPHGRTRVGRGEPDSLGSRCPPRVLHVGLAPERPPFLGRLPPHVEKWKSPRALTRSRQMSLACVEGR